MGICALVRIRDERLDASILDTVLHVLGAASLSAMLMVATGSILGGAIWSALSALRLWLFAVVYLRVARVILLTDPHPGPAIEALATPTLIVGAGVVGDHLVSRLIEDPRYGMRPVGFLDSDPLAERSAAVGVVPILGGPDDLAEAIEHTGARRVILAFSSEPDQALVEKVRECQERGSRSHWCRGCTRRSTSARPSITSAACRCSRCGRPTLRLAVRRQARVDRTFARSRWWRWRR